ncbi:MAG: ribosomal-processing cysteine protease Prp [Eubacterium sp.]|nr:ribosomal-processing cysteine protease Prp [Eubacterium sp.]
MIKIEVKKQNNDIIGFYLLGHAGAGEYGEDIVCASVSILTINCINSIEELCEEEFSLDSDEERGMIDFSLNHKPSKESSLLLQSWLMGISAIADQYRDYVTLINR